MICVESKIVVHCNFYFSVASSNISNEQFELIFIDIFMAISQDKNNFDMEISLEVINI